MCVTNIYVDLYPDGRRQEFRQTSICQYGVPGRPCAKTSTLENPVRKIQWDEPSTEYMLTAHARTFAQNQNPPSTPPRSSGGSMNRRSGGGYSSSGEEGLRGRRRDSKTNSKEKEKDRRPEPIRRATREHKKERIVIVDSPPTPRTPPQLFNQVFTAPNSPIPRTGRPIIVDERPRPRVPSNGAVVGDRNPFIRRSRSSSRPRRASRSSAWDSPSSSHTSFDLQSRAEEERIAASERRRQERDSRIKELEAERRRASFIAAQDEEIRRRPAVPLAPPPRLRNRPFLHPIVDQPSTLPSQPQPRERERGERIVPVIVMNDDAIRREEEVRLRREERERAQRLRWEAAEEEAMRQRLRERQMPMRRFSVGPAMRRHRVLYDDGVYRYE